MAHSDPHDSHRETGDDEALVAAPIATERAGIKLPVLALVGRPNVGKSTLFNRLTRTREALVAPVPGVTRDRREAVVAREGLHFRLIDTGGMTFDKAAAFGPEVDGQIRAALAEAALAWLIVDVADGLNPYDAELARILQASGRPWMVLANKTEGPLRQGRLGEFYGLGAPDVVGVSAMQGFGVVEALQKAAERAPVLRREASLPAEAPEPAKQSPEDGESAAAVALPTDVPISEGAPEADPATEDEPFDSIRVAFVGRPNVGKSSLLNAILGEPRFIVSDIPGTTREAIDVHVTVEGERFMLVDTAGLRRKARTVQYLDKLSAVNTLTALDRAEVAVLVVDALEGAVDQDAHIAGYILDRGRACVLALNKWDTVRGGAIPAGAEARTGVQQPQAIQENIEHALRFMHHAEAVRVSALERTGLRHLFRAIRTAHRQFTRSVSTADLNRVIQIVTRHTPPPARGRSPTKVHYGVQIGVRPPTFRLFTNHPEQVRQEYTRFMEQQLRYHLGFDGTPLRIEWRGKDSAKDSGKDGGKEGARDGGEETAEQRGRSKPAGARASSDVAGPTQSRRQRARAKEALGVRKPRPQREKSPKTQDDKTKSSGRKRNAGKSSRRPTKPAMGKRHGGRRPR